MAVAVFVVYEWIVYDHLRHALFMLKKMKSKQQQQHSTVPIWWYSGRTHHTHNLFRCFLLKTFCKWIVFCYYFLFLMLDHSLTKDSNDRRNEVNKMKEEIKDIFDSLFGMSYEILTHYVSFVHHLQMHRQRQTNKYKEAKVSSHFSYCIVRLSSPFFYMSSINKLNFRCSGSFDFDAKKPFKIISFVLFFFFSSLTKYLLLHEITKTRWVSLLFFLHRHSESSNRINNFKKFLSWFFVVARLVYWSDSRYISHIISTENIASHKREQ